MKIYSRGKLARLTDVNIETIRYYEKIGLLDKPLRNNLNHRIYNHETIKRIHFIKKTQNLGFKLEEIKVLLSLTISKESVCISVKKKTEEKLFEVRNKIKDLKRIESILNDLINKCNSKSTTLYCPIIDAFNDK